VWNMLPAGDVTEQMIQTLIPLLSPGDTIIDGGNTNFNDDIRRANMLKQHGLNYIDQGTSGGVWGLENGFCIMVGGEQELVKRLEPAFITLAPTDGYVHCGPVGSGHFVKMVHNGIEYGLMQAYAEGFEILAKANSDKLPADQRFDLDLADVAEVWRRGSVISSWLLDLTSIALTGDAKLDQYTGFVQDSGEGRWTIEAAIAEAVPATVLSAALYARFRSRQEHTFADKLLSAMRHGFGGHQEPGHGG
jgi:6-phosphogluconate dehydrogenase